MTQDRKSNKVRHYPHLSDFGLQLHEKPVRQNGVNRNDKISNQCNSVTRQTMYVQRNNEAR